MIASRSRPFVLSLIVGLLAAAAAVQAVRDRRYGELGGPRDALYVRSGAAVGRLALSFDALVADVYWIRALQYFGRTRLSNDPDKSYADLYPLLDLTTTLDPQFSIAYRFGAVFLSEGYPDGPSEPHRAIELLQKGFRHNPTRWEFLHDIAFVYYWWLEDYEQAARWFERASQVPGAPEWLGPLAAVTLARGGDRENSRLLWRRLLESAEHEYLRRAAEHRLIQLAVMDQLDQLESILQRYRVRYGEQPRTWAPLVDQGWLRDVPADPDGVPYIIDAGTGRPTVDPTSRFYPLPTAPSAPVGSAPARELEP
jgi:tetratricopeptide (TPR) repeat protein